MQACWHVVVPVTVDSPEKQRVGTTGWCHGTADQDWSSAEVAAAVVFKLTPSGCDLWTGTTTCQHARLRVTRESAMAGWSVDEQTIEGAVTASVDKRGASHLREDQAWSERHGIEQ
jgi:hypothetical protein